MLVFRVEVICHLENLTVGRMSSEWGNSLRLGCNESPLPILDGLFIIDDMLNLMTFDDDWFLCIIS